MFINALIDKGAGTESAFKLLKDGDISNANAAGYLGTLKGSWKLQKIHPEFLPKLYTVSATDLTIDPVGESANKVLRQVVGLAAYKNSIQTYEHFSERREQDGGDFDAGECVGFLYVIRRDGGGGALAMPTQAQGCAASMRHVRGPLDGLCPRHRWPRQSQPMSSGRGNRAGVHKT
mgnify:CR=1 FL=1